MAVTDEELVEAEDAASLAIWQAIERVATRLDISAAELKEVASAFREMTDDDSPDEKPIHSVENSTWVPVCGEDWWEDRARSGVAGFTPRNMPHVGPHHVPTPR